MRFADFYDRQPKFPGIPWASLTTANTTFVGRKSGEPTDFFVQLVRKARRRTRMRLRLTRGRGRV